MMNSIGKRVLALLMLLVLAAGLLSACGTSGQKEEKADTSENSASAEKKVMYAGSLGNFGATNLDPAEDWNGWYLSFYGVTETLFKQSNSYEAVPCLVESYSEPEDGITWKLTLRDDVYFSNGEKMTAQSVVDCFTRTLAENVRGAGTLNVTDMSADGQVLTLVTPVADPTFLYSLTDPLLSVYYVSDGEDYDSASHCTGPFVVKSFTRETEAVVVKNENYWGGKVNIDEAHLITFSDEDAMVMAMQNGELDHIDGTAAALLVCNESTGFHVQSASTSRAEKFVFNHKDSAFGSDPVIREVLALAVDREGYAKASNGTKKANYGIYPATLSYGDNSKLNIHITSQDLAAAQKLLDDADYIDSDNDGVREKDGTPISITMVTTSNMGIQDFADVLSSDLKSVGIELKTQTYENLDSFETFAGVKWDVCIEGKYMTPTGDASYFFDQDVITNGSCNYGGYSNPELDKLAAKLHETFGDEERNELVFQMEQMLLDDNSFIVYCNGTNTYITDSAVKGYEPNPSNYYFMDAKMDLIK